ncbi:MAG TPA: DUF6438 domain-containing protein [Longimicrobium sp.]|jgi:hypothetical protein|uniref:DUF6438 domain-containing protein n=1 Tax=Longimicrobium sp. TaxID=2029185 RepID=UPI002ED8312B
MIRSARTLASAALLLLAAACQPPRPAPAAAPEGGAAAAGSAAVDSLVLMRTRCFGTCPAYRVVLRPSGEVRFRQSWPDSLPEHRATIAPAQFNALVAGADAAGFWALPTLMAENTGVCGMARTDSPTTVVGVYGAARTHVVEDYYGCTRIPGPLRAWEARIDSVAGVSRWLVTPAHR